MLFLGLVCGAAWGKTYWVSPTGTAAWTNATSETPLIGAACASLATANAKLVAGDTAYLRGGTYATYILPAHSGSSNNPIAYLAYAEETPVVSNGTNAYGTYFYGLCLPGRSWIKVHGVTFQRDSAATYQKTRLLEFTAGSSYNEVSDCTFDGRFEFCIVRIWDGGSTPHPTGVPCVHNWIHGCTFKNIGELVSTGTAVDDCGGVYLGVPAYDGHSTNNTIEGCTFYGGGHHNLETYTKYNVIRSNFFHFEGMITNAAGRDASFGADENGLYGNRNIQVYDGYNSDGTFNLLEGNRFGTSGPPPDDSGGDGLTITAPKNIIRYNAIYNSLNNAVLFKFGALSYGTTNRFYNNTLFKAGRYQNTNSITRGAYWEGALIRWYGGYTNWETVVKNNILFRYGGVSEITGGPANPQLYGTIITNNWLTSKGDPSFVSTNITDPTDIAQPNLRLTRGSGAIDAAMPLTYAKGNAAGSTTLLVDDALYFQDGTWGSVLAGHKPDVLAVGSSTNRAAVAAIDYSNNTITLASPLSWNDRAPIYLYAKSDGVVVFSGDAPDLGAHEYGVPAAFGNLRPGGSSGTKPK